MPEREPEGTDRVQGRIKTDDPAGRVLQLVKSDTPVAAPETGIGHADLPNTELSSVLEDIVRRFGSFMRRTAHRHGIDVAELDDVVQETRIRLWKALDTPEKVRQAPASYIYRTTMSAALDFLRRRRSRREDSIDHQPQSVVDLQFVTPRGADSATLEGDVKDALDRAVNLLVESRRGVVRMYLAGFDREEIADVLGWSEAKTRNLLYRGLGDVRQTLEQWGYGPGAKQ